MARVLLSSADQAEQTIHSILAVRRELDAVVIGEYQVNDYLGISLEISVPKADQSFYLTGPLGLSKDLRKMGLKSGDRVLVARHPHLEHRSAHMYMVAPLTEVNQFLVGKSFEKPFDKTPRKKAGLKKEVAA